MFLDRIDDEFLVVTHSHIFWVHEFLLKVEFAQPGDMEVFIIFGDPIAVSVSILDTIHYPKGSHQARVEFGS